MLYVTDLQCNVPASLAHIFFVCLYMQVTEFAPGIGCSVLTIVIATILLFNEVGPFCFLITVLALLIIPLQIAIAHKVGHLRQATAKKTDTRVSTMNEIITGMKVIKMYCWEMPFSKIINGLRR